MWHGIHGLCKYVVPLLANFLYQVYLCLWKGGCLSWTLWEVITFLYPTLSSRRLVNSFFEAGGPHWSIDY